MPRCMQPWRLGVGALGKSEPGGLGEAVCMQPWHLVPGIALLFAALAPGARSLGQIWAWRPAGCVHAILAPSAWGMS